MPKQATTSGMNPLPTLIRASAWDAGNASMRAAGRTIWSRKDLNAAADCQNGLISSLYGEGPRGCIRFSYAEAMEKAGMLTLYTKDFWGDFEASWASYEASLGDAA